MAATRRSDLRDIPLYFAFKRRSVNNEHKETFHCHHGLEILFIHQGRGTMVVNHKRYEIVPGMLCIFQPHQLHHLQFDYSNGNAFERSIAIFEPTRFEPYFEPWPALKAFYQHLYRNKLATPCIYGAENAAELTSVFKSMQERMAAIETKDQIEEISLFLVSLFRSLKPVWLTLSREAAAPAARKNYQADNILQWVEQHYAEPFRLETMAKDLHLSPYHLSHLFKESIGISITDYIATRRMHQAVLLLTTTSKPVAMIAEEIGITNSSYFCKLFKSQIGMTPFQYRKRWSSY